MRQTLVESGRLSGVLSVPPGLAYGTTLIRLGLLMISANDVPTDAVRFVNIGHDRLSRPANRGRTNLRKDALVAAIVAGDMLGDRALARDIAPEELAENNYVLTPARYLNTGPRERIDALVRDTDSAELAELVEMIRPINLQKALEAEYTILEAAPGDVGPRGFLQRPPRRIEVDRATYLRALNQQVKPGDLVLSIKGTIGVVGLVPDGVPGEGEREIWTAGQSLMILRMKKRANMDAAALYEYLSDGTVQEFIKSMAGGTAIQNLGIKDLKSFPVPVPDRRTMEEVQAGFVERQAIFDEIERLQRQVVEMRAAHWPHDRLSNGE